MYSRDCQSTPAFLSVLCLFALCLAVHGQLQLSVTQFYLYSEVTNSYCFIDSSFSNKPIICQGITNINSASYWSLTGVTDAFLQHTYPMLRTPPGILDGGDYGYQWCYPHDYVGFQDNTIYCSGAPVVEWFQLYKVDTSGSPYFYTGDMVTLYSTLTNTNASFGTDSVITFDASEGEPLQFLLAF